MIVTCWLPIKLQDTWPLVQASSYWLANHKGCYILTNNQSTWQMSTGTGSSWFISTSQSQRLTQTNYQTKYSTWTMSTDSTWSILTSQSQKLLHINCQSKLSTWHMSTDSSWFIMTSQLEGLLHAGLRWHMTTGSNKRHLHSERNWALVFVIYPFPPFSILKYCFSLILTSIVSCWLTTKVEDGTNRNFGFSLVYRNICIASLKR